MIVSDVGLGQINLLSKSSSDTLAASVISKADPMVRDIIAKNRILIADSLISGLPFMAMGGAAAIGTWFLADEATTQALGYVASAGLGGYGIYSILSKLVSASPPAPPSPPASIPGVAQGAIDQTVTSLVNQADPRVRAIIDEERARLASAFQTGLPWVAVGAAVAVLSFFFAPSDLFKAVGYLGSIGLMTTGTWVGLDAMK